MQDLSYYYDPVGNVTRIRDDADTQDVIFFRNQRVEPSASYTYDPLYRLIAATGREHLGQTGGALLAAAAGHQRRLVPHRPAAARRRQRDGHLHRDLQLRRRSATSSSMAHQVSSGSWTRRYSYAEPSQIVGGRDRQPADRHQPARRPGRRPVQRHLRARRARQHDADAAPARADLGRGRPAPLHRPAAAGGGTPQTTYYVYDAGGQRVRKATDRQAAAGQAASRRPNGSTSARIEIYREYATDGTTVTLERETLHVTDGDTAIALVETRTTGTDKAPAQLVRYQYGNHLGSAVLELDDQSNIITYEEYFPFGSTSYQAVAVPDRPAQALPLHRQGTRRGKRPLLPRRPLLRAVARPVDSLRPRRNGGRLQPVRLRRAITRCG